MMYPCVSHLGKLDHERASLRLLLALERSGQGLMRKDLTKVLGDQGVGRSAMLSSLESCIGLRLVEDVKSKIGSHYCAVSMLTNLGHQVALKLLEVEEILEDGSTKRES